jgi:hypothetical protein
VALVDAVAYLGVGAKHTPELPQFIVNAGGVGALVDYVNESEGIAPPWHHDPGLHPLSWRRGAGGCCDAVAYPGSTPLSSPSSSSTLAGSAP